MQPATGVLWGNWCGLQRKPAPRGPGVRGPKRVKLTQIASSKLRQLSWSSKECFLGNEGGFEVKYGSFSLAKIM